MFKKYDFIVEYKNNTIVANFYGLEEKDLILIEKFHNKKEWLDFKKYPTLEHVLQELEKIHNISKEWFLIEFGFKLQDAFNKISIYQYKKLYKDVIGEEKFNLLLTDVYLYLLFLEKELKYPNIPTIYSNIPDPSLNTKAN